MTARTTECRFHILLDNEIKEVPSENGIPAIPPPAAHSRELFSDLVTLCFRPSICKIRITIMCIVDIVNKLNTFIKIFNPRQFYAFMHTKRKRNVHPLSSENSRLWV